MRDSRPTLLPAVDVMLIEQLLRLLSTGQRLEILRMLAGHTLCVTDLADGLFQSKGSVSRDLAELRRTGLVYRETKGTKRYYRLTERVHMQRHWQADQISVTTPAGDWLLVHVQREASDCELIEPPGSVVGEVVRLQPLQRIS